MLEHYRQYMAETGGDTAGNEASIPPAKKQRTGHLDLVTENVAVGLAIVETPVIISEDSVSRDNNENDDTSSAVTTSMRTAAKAKKTLYQECRLAMNVTFVPVRPPLDNRAKLSYSVHGLHCVGAVPYHEAPLKGKVHVASIQISMKKKGFANMFVSPGMLVKVEGDDSDLDYIVQEILCYTKEPHR